MAFLNFFRFLLNKPLPTISLSSGLTQENAHGYVWIKDTTKEPVEHSRITPAYFMLSDPSCLEGGMQYGVWVELIKQLTTMGILVDRICFTSRGINYCYRADRYVLVYSGASESTRIRVRSA